MWLGYWHATLETLVLVLLSTGASVFFGLPLGVVAARTKKLYRCMSPILDVMQTLPTFVYLIPTLMLFGLGMVPGLVSTVVFAMPAMIRLTYLGLNSVPRELLEAGDSLGASAWQRLIKIELPYSAPALIAAVNQTLMLCLSMVVVAALVGSGGLGVPVVRALNTVNVAQGFEAGLAIVVVAIVLDRVLQRPAWQRVCSLEGS